MKFSPYVRTAASVGVFICLLPVSAFALGGLDKAKTVMQDVQTGLYSIVAVLSVIYLIYMGVMAFTEKKSWSDFGWAIVYISFVGAAIAIASWAFTLFV